MYKSFETAISIAHLFCTFPSQWMDTWISFTVVTTFWSGAFIFALRSGGVLGSCSFLICLIFGFQYNADVHEWIYYIIGWDTFVFIFCLKAERNDTDDRHREQT